MKKPLITIITILIAVLITSTVVQAIGTLTPSGTAGDDTQYTLNDIYAKITADTDATVGSGTMTVPGTQTASFYTLTEIYEALPDWKTLSAATTTVSAGYYEATDLATVDTDLTAGNIKDGTTIFGVEGTVTEGTPAITWSTEQGNYNLSGAESFCAGTVDGTTGWRLPNIAELIEAMTSQFRLGSGSGFIDDTYYWSSTPFSVLNLGASFTGGSYMRDAGLSRGSTYRTRCVK
jgi:hypothetical protein